jgi:hypothetical protein
MAAYIYTIKDRETEEVLFRGRQRECGDFINCDPKYIWTLSERTEEYAVKTKYAKYKIEREWDTSVESFHGGSRKKNTACLSCGKPLVGVASTRKRCPECAEKWNREHKRLQAQIRRNQPQSLRGIKDIDSEQFEMQKPCIGCAYFTGLSAYARTCNYIFLEDHSRGCPPGSKCTKRKPQKITA